MEYRNPVYTENGLIDCEINHPELGRWIPFTVNPADDRAGFDVAALDAAIRAAGGIAPYVSPPITSAEVDDERNRRIEENFTFGGVAYDFDAASKARITGMGALAGFAIGAGAQAGDLTWHGQETPFVWIASDNSPVPMDAPTCFAFAQAAAAHEAAHIFAARALKDMTTIPADYTADGYWP